MKSLFLYIAICLSFSAFAQKGDLKKLCTKLNDVFSSKNGLHLEYTMAMQGNAQHPETESMQMSMFKLNEQDYKMVIGEEQILLHSGKTMLQVNHSQKSIVIQTDSTSNVSSQALFADFRLLIDSASSVSDRKEKDELIYTLKFSSEFIYTSVTLKFSTKTELLTSVYAEFSPDYPEPYHSLTVTYTLWDLKWKDSSGVLALNQFVERKNDIYVPVTAWNSYKVFQPAQGKINVKLK